jgi:hypothetical protein
MTQAYHVDVKRLLDSEITLADLPPELRAEGEDALRLIAGLDRGAVTLSSGLGARVMTTVRARAKSPVRRAWRWLSAPHEVEVRLRVRPWAVSGLGLAAAAALALLFTQPRAPEPSANVMFVRFVLHAPDAKRVAVAGTFNQWDQNAAPLVLAGTDGVWTTTLALPVGQHQYAFVVDGRSWIVDPAAPAVDDGFGRRNSVVAVTARGARTL